MILEHFNCKLTATTQTSFMILIKSNLKKEINQK